MGEEIEIEIDDKLKSWVSGDKILRSVDSAGEERAEFSFSVKEALFSGHFEGYPILSAVAQVNIALHVASSSYGTPLTIKKIRRIKFTHTINSSPVTLKLCYNKEERVLTFKMVQGPFLCCTGAVEL